MRCEWVVNIVSGARGLGLGLKERAISCGRNATMAFKVTEIDTDEVLNRTFVCDAHALLLSDMVTTRGVVGTCAWSLTLLDGREVLAA